MNHAPYLAIIVLIIVIHHKNSQIVNLKVESAKVSTQLLKIQHQNWGRSMEIKSLKLELGVLDE